MRPAYGLSRDSLPGSGQADWGWGCRHRRPSCTTVSEPYCSARKPDCRTRILHRLTMLLRRTSTRARACRRRWPSYAARLRAPWKLPMRSHPSWPRKRLRRVLHGAAESGMLSGPAPGRPSAGYAPTSRMVPALGTTCRFSLSKGQVCFVSLGLGFLGWRLGCAVARRVVHYLPGVLHVISWCTFCRHRPASRFQKFTYCAWLLPEGCSGVLPSIALRTSQPSFVAASPAYSSTLYPCPKP